MASSSNGWRTCWGAKTTSDIIGMLIGAAVGGGGLVGLLFFFLRRYMEKKLIAMETAENNRRKARIVRARIDDELAHATGRLLFWLYRAVTTQKRNGELDEAFQALQAAEARKKEWDRQILAEARNEE